MDFDWRARIGVLVPSRNVTLEPELACMLNWGITPHFTRIEVEKSTSMIESVDSGNREKVEREVIEETLRGSKQLRAASVDFILFGCTTGSFIPGNDFHEKICDEIKSSVNIPATTCSTSLIEAIKCLDVKILLN